MLKNNFDKTNKNLEEIQKILDLPLDTIMKLLQSDELVINSEKEICDIVINYIKLINFIIMKILLFKILKFNFNQKLQTFFLLFIFLYRLILNIIGH